MRRKNAEHIAEELEALGFMPERFITGYLELVREGMAVSQQAARYDEHVAAQVKKRFHTHGGGLKDEEALRFKAWVDRQLRAIGRDVQAYLNAKHGTFENPQERREARKVAKDIERRTELKCKGCAKYVSWQWSHCAWCGKELNGQDAAKPTPDAGADLVAGSSGPTGEDAHGEDAG